MTGALASDRVAGIAFVPRTGRVRRAARQDLTRLSEDRGIFMPVDAANYCRPAGVTEGTLSGPFPLDGAPKRQMGKDTCPDRTGAPCRSEGCAADLTGNPSRGARAKAQAPAFRSSPDPDQRLTECRT